MSEPCDLAAVDARRLIGSKRLSAAELTESCIGRVLAVDHAVNAMVARDFDRARAAAASCDAATIRGDAIGPLHGLPLGVKDLEDRAGLRTTYGSTLFRDHVPARDDLIVQAARQAGAIVLGKTNTPEWGAGANTRNAVYGATGNPFNPLHSAAGSSGGSAAALATGMVPLATGSDMGGSLRNPASFCGVVGFRPTPGLVPGEKRAFGWSPLSVLGPMARTVADICLLLSCIASESARDPLAYTVAGHTTRRPEEFTALPAVDLARLRVALTPDFGVAPTERHIAEVFAEKTAMFRHVFGRCEEASPDCTGTNEAFETLRAAAALASHHDRVRDTPDAVGPNVHADVAAGLRLSALDVARALQHQTVLYHRWVAFFDVFDIILSPAITISPRPWSELFPTSIDGKPTRTYFHWLALAYAVSTVGHPAVSLPVGLDRNGMPFGLQIVGRRGGDAQVLAVAMAVERLLAGDPRTTRPTPNIAALAAAAPLRDVPGFLGFG